MANENIDYLCERRAQDNTDRHIDSVAAADEFLKILEKNHRHNNINCQEFDQGGRL